MPPLASTEQFAFLSTSTEEYAPAPPVLAAGAQPDSAPLIVTFWFPVDVALRPGARSSVPFTFLQACDVAAYAGDATTSPMPHANMSARDPRTKACFIPIPLR